MGVSRMVSQKISLQERKHRSVLSIIHCLKEDRNSKFCGISDSSLEQKGGGRRWLPGLQFWTAGRLVSSLPNSYLPASLTSMPCEGCILGS